MSVRPNYFIPLIRRGYSQAQKGAGSAKTIKKDAAATSTSEGSISNSNVKGLSSACVKPVSGGKVGPGASVSGEYKVPEYFSFNRFSYAEAEVEMASFRCPQPSALKKA